MTIRRIKEGHVFRKPNAKSGVCMIGAKKQHISNQELTIYYDMRTCENSFSVPERHADSGRKAIRQLRSLSKGYIPRPIRKRFSH